MVQAQNVVKQWFNLSICKETVKVGNLSYTAAGQPERAVKAVYHVNKERRLFLSVNDKRGFERS